MRKLNHANPFQRPSSELDALNKQEGDRWVRYRWERRGSSFVEKAIDRQGRPIDVTNPANWRSLDDVYFDQETFEGIALVQTPESDIACITLRNINRRFHTVLPDEFCADVFLQHEWSVYIRGSARCYLEPIPCGFRIIGTTRRTEPCVRICKGMRDELDPNPMRQVMKYEHGPADSFLSEAVAAAAIRWRRSTRLLSVSKSGSSRVFQ